MRALAELIRRILLVCAVLMASPSAGLALQAARSKHILVLHWYDRDYPVNVKFDQEFQAALQDSAAEGIEFYYEYLETNKFPGENQSLLLSDYLRQKYAGRTIDVVVTRASPSLDFLLKHRHELFPHTPIVFATERPVSATLMSKAGATGIVYANGYRKTLDLALKLHPETKQIYVISGTLTRDRSIESIARGELQGYTKRVAVIYLTDLTMEELTVRMHTLPKASIVVYVWQQALNQQGKVVETQDVLARIAPAAQVPMYGMSFANVGLGIIGGYVWTLEFNTAKLAEITLRVANGARPADIPIERAPEVPMFDWRQLQHWGVPEDRLPPGSIVRFRELTMWQQYKWRIIATILVLGLQTLLIGALLVERRRVRRGAAALGRAQRVLRESEERFRNMADTAPVMIWVSGPDKLCTFFNKGWLNFTGRRMEEELGDGWAECVHPDDRESCSATYSSSFDAGIPFQMEYRLRRSDGEYRSLICAGVPRFQQGGVFAGYIGSCLDITELKHSQEKALAGQKLESMGLLAGGIAHDFNNLLGGILAWAELAVTEHAGGVPNEEELMHIKAAAIGGAEIVRELMTYGGKNSPAFEAVDCSRLVREMLTLLKVSISKHATLKTDLGTENASVHANPAQIRQLIMNLVINASEAIGERDGVIRVKTRMLPADQNVSVVVAANLPRGDYIELEVADTGRGMSEEAKARIFDPFFTTKPTGRGLGLAVVHGVVRAHGGAIRVVSECGCGTAFQILLPCIAKHEGEVPSAAVCRVAGECSSGDGTVLIIEDEGVLRLAVSKMLRKKGYSVIEAGDGNAGVDLFLANASKIDVVLLDMTLPGKSGREILDEVQRVRPDARVIITSAYSQEKVRNSLVGLQPCVYIQKPYQLGALVNLIRSATAGNDRPTIPQTEDSVRCVSDLIRDLR